jgi:deazaflavin-dependent oxidoreductase (nitroreductase family)
MKMSPAQQWFLRQMSRANIALYRLTGGAVGGSMFGAPVLLLTTVGRKSGEPRTVALLYLRDGDRLVLVASKGGHDEHPLWFTNLEKTPEATVELGRERREVRARVAGDEERDALWPKMVALYRGYAGYQKKTERRIPLVVLEAR